jgi:hypothetical protein
MMVEQERKVRCNTAPLEVAQKVCRVAGFAGVMEGARPRALL